MSVGEGWNRDELRPRAGARDGEARHERASAMSQPLARAVVGSALRQARSHLGSGYVVSAQRAGTRVDTRRSEH